METNDELERRLLLLIDANERVATVYRNEVEKATRLALDNLTQHLSTMNEFRESNNDAFIKFREIINDMTIRMLTRVEYKEAHENLIKLIDSLRFSIETHKAEASGSKNLTTYILGALAVIFAAITAFDKLYH